MDIRQCALWISVVVLLNLQLACSISPQIDDSQLDDSLRDSWETKQLERQLINAWSIEGKLGIQTETNGGSFDLYWLQNDDQFNIRLLAPLGQGTVLVDGNHEAVKIRTKDGVQYAHDVEALLANEFGVSVPVKGLRDWLRGLPISDKALSGQQWDAEGNLQHLKQDGWSVEMKSYRQVANTSLPHKFYLGRADHPELDIRLIIRQWNVSPK